MCKLLNFAFEQSAQMLEVFSLRGRVWKPAAGIFCHSATAALKGAEWATSPGSEMVFGFITGVLEMAEVRAACSKAPLHTAG